MTSSSPRMRRADRSDCSYCGIRDRAICAHCGPEELARLNECKSYHAIDKGAEVLTAGRESPYVGTIVSGVISLSRTQADGRRQLMGLQFPSEFVGGALRPRASCDAVAATDVLLCRFERRTFDRILAESPTLRDRLLDMTMDELDAMRDWLSILGLKSAREKVAAFLLMLWRRSGAASSRLSRDIVELPLTRGEIGESLGLTIETVSRQISKLRLQGVIGFENARSFELLNAQALREAAGEVDSEAVH